VTVEAPDFALGDFCEDGFEAALTFNHIADVTELLSPHMVEG
jgi:hypothetical protein